MCFGLGQSVSPVTPGAIKWRKGLYGVMIGELAVAMIKIFLFDPLSGIFELFTIFMLYIAASQLNFCFCVIYQIYCMFDVLFCLIYFFTYLQNSSNLFPGSKDRNYPHPEKVSPGEQCAMSAFQIIFLIFYTGACTVAFYAYREFKAETLVSGQGGGFFGPGAQAQPQYQVYDDENAPRQGYYNYGGNNNQQRAGGGGGGGGGGRFQGPGVSIG